MSETEVWLEQAIWMAKENAAKGDGPFAAIVVRNGEIVGTGVNRVGSEHDPTAHAELLAIREACIRLALPCVSMRAQGKLEPFYVWASR